MPPKEDAKRLPMGAPLIRGAVGNTLYGNSTGQFITNGQGNTAIGDHALQNTVNSLSTAVGSFALNSNTTGANNTAVGTGALRSNITGNFNAAFGVDALRNTVTGNFNSAFGENTSTGFVNGSSNTFIGFSSTCTDGLSFATALGADSICLVPNSIQLGRAGQDAVNCGSSLSINAVQLTDANSHIVSGISAPLAVTGAGAGVGASINLTNATDLSGQITLTTAGAPAINSTVFTVTFNKTWGVTPNVLLTPGNAATASLTVTQLPFVSSSTQTTFVVTSNGVALPVTTLVWYYHAMH